MSEASSNTLDKIEAAAALYAAAPEAKKRAIALEYLALLGHFLIDQKRSDSLLFPLLDVIESLESGQQSGVDVAADEERRQGETEASPQVLARISAVIDLLIAAGFSQEHAAQILTRQMLSKNLKLPATSGDPRGWRRVQLWRQRFLATGRETPEWPTYQEFKDSLIQTYGPAFAHTAVRTPVWDRRS